METVLPGEIRLTQLLKAHKTLQDALSLPFSTVVRDASIQRFEYCFELAWKTMKRILAYRGIAATSPREVFRLAAREQLIEDPKIWFEYMDKRNLTSHTYDEATAQAIFSILPHFSADLAAFLGRITPS